MDDLFWEVYQHGRMLTASARAEEAVASTQRTRGELSATDKKIDRLALLCHAMWELLRERHGLSEQDLLDKIREMDLRDGVQDGALRSQPRPCGECGRTIGTHDASCLYCGAFNPVSSAFHVR